MSKLPGQSRHSLPDRFRQSRAISGHSGETFARASRAVLLSDAVTTRLPSGLNAMLRTSPHPRGAHVVSISSILALACGHQHTADLLVTDGKDCADHPRMRKRRPTPHHVFGDRRLGNLKPQHQQFAMARFHQSFRRCGGLAARRPRAAAGDAGGRLSQRCIFRHFRTPCAGRTCEAPLTSAEALRERCST